MRLRRVRVRDGAAAARVKAVESERKWETRRLAAARRLVIPADSLRDSEESISGLGSGNICLRCGPSGFPGIINPAQCRRLFMEVTFAFLSFCAEERHKD